MNIKNCLDILIKNIMQMPVRDKRNLDFCKKTLVRADQHYLQPSL
jgi:hypothetical protein